MRHLMLAATMVLSLGTAALAQAPDTQLMTPIQKFVDSFNKGDTAAARATHAADADLVIIDEVPPYFWRGASAFQTWVSDLDSDAKKQGITDQMVTLGKMTRSEMSGDHAYVVVPAVYTYKQRGVSMRSAAQMTVALTKRAGAWLIHGWTWTGPKPTASPAAP
jgi:hypothetical protein